MTDYIIKKTDSSHTKGITALEKECFSVPWSENAVADFLNRNDTLTFVAECDGEVIGYVGSYSVLGEVYITNVAVTEKFRQKGVACNLLFALETECEKEKCDFITLEVRKSNLPAIKLYEKSGFENVGERKDFYEQPTENALLYTKYFGDKK